jgi:ABC-2 type transport system ATP-binding protein
LETILSVKNIHKTFGKIKAVNDVSFEINKGNVYGILGPNGSGKSTTLGIVLSIINKTAGEFSWFNAQLTTQQALKKVGAIIERPNFYPYMTAEENLNLVCKIKEIPTLKVNKKLELVGLLDRKDSKFKTFSLGMKQRLAIASALLNDPEILILDEPTNGLDPQGIHQIRDLIKKIASQGTTILLASHLLDEVEKVCSHVVVLRYGKILFSGKVDEMSSKKGYLELKANHPEALLLALKSFSGITEIIREEEIIKVRFSTEIHPEDINRFLFEKGIILQHLAHKKESLEEQFLELTNKKG